MMMGFIVTSFLLILLVPLPGNALGICSHPQDPGFYEKNNYKIGKIELHTPFNFLFLVRQRLDQLRSSLAIKEHNAFDSSAYDESFTIVETAIKADGALGRDSPMKIVAVTSSLENCQENGEAPTVDVVYRVFTTDPIPAIKAAPEERRLATEEPATTAAAQTVNPSFKFTPHFSYDATRRGLTGLDASVRLPT